MNENKSKIRLLFVDDDPVTCSVMERHCQDAGYSCHVCQSALEGLKYFETVGADFIVTDLRMPEMNGFEFLKSVRAIDQQIPMLVMTGYSSVENAVEAMKLGANDFIKKPFDFDELEIIIQRNLEASRLRDENRLLRRQIHEQQEQEGRFGMTGHSPVMQSLFSQIEKIADVSCNVIVTGESGTGKELVARALHEYSPRREAPFVVIDCGALTESLLESELFGHEKGAFTGAAQRKKGLMEQASGGTLFLDEISNISDAMQMKLMRAIESQEITRVGSTGTIPIDLRIIAASNRDLAAMVRAGTFRHDFYHRLNVVNIHVPSLSQRREDIPALVDRFVHQFAEQYDRKVTGFDAESMQRLIEAEWSGNVRELKNAVERCVIMAEDERIHWGGHDSAGNGGDDAGWDFPEGQIIPLEELEERYIRYALEQSDGKKTRAARALGIDKTTLWRKLRKYEISSGENDKG